MSLPMRCIPCAEAGAARVRDACSGEGLPADGAGSAGGDLLGERCGRGPQGQEQADGTGEAGDLY